MKIVKLSSVDEKDWSVGRSRWDRLRIANKVTEPAAKLLFVWHAVKYFAEIWFSRSINWGRGDYVSNFSRTNKLLLATMRPRFVFGRQPVWEFRWCYWLSWLSFLVAFLESFQVYGRLSLFFEKHHYLAINSKALALSKLCFKNSLLAISVVRHNSYCWKATSSWV